MLNTIRSFLLGSITILGLYALTKELVTKSARAYISDINNLRTNKMTITSRLNSIAYCRAVYVAQGHWTHQGHQTCFRKFGLKSNYGEILAKDFDNDSDTITAWLNSPIHKAVMLGRWRYAGEARFNNIGVVVFSNYGR